jgi:hypothetical protein
MGHLHSEFAEALFYGSRSGWLGINERSVQIKKDRVDREH